MKKTVCVVFLLCSVLALNISAQQGPEGFQFVVGPRVGAAYTLTTNEGFTEAVNEVFFEGSYVPFTTVFGFNLEQRVILGNTNSHFVFQEVILVG